MAKLTLRNASSGRAQLTARPLLATFLNRLPHLNLSDTGRRNVCARFGLTDAELSDALANAYGQKRGRLC